MNRAASHTTNCAFCGLLSPLSSHSIVECCVFPAIMFGSESWVQNTALLLTLESFQVELGEHKIRIELQRYYY